MQAVFSLFGSNLTLLLHIWYYDIAVGGQTDEQKPYRLGYPNQKDDLHENDMLRFYRGEIPSKPQGRYSVIEVEQSSGGIGGRGRRFFFGGLVFGSANFVLRVVLLVVL